MPSQNLKAGAGVVMRPALQTLRGGGSKTGLMVVAALSFVFCDGWTMSALLALNPFVVFWALAAVLALVAGGMVMTEPETPAGRRPA